MGKNHDTIDRHIDNRESLEIGKSMSPQRHKHENLLVNASIPKVLNDLNKHKESQRKNYGFNVLTGSYSKLNV